MRYGIVEMQRGPVLWLWKLETSMQPNIKSKPHEKSPGWPIRNLERIWKISISQYLTCLLVINHPVSHSHFH